MDGLNLCSRRVVAKSDAFVLQTYFYGDPSFHPGKRYVFAGIKRTAVIQRKATTIHRLLCMAVSRHYRKRVVIVSCSVFEIMDRKLYCSCPTRTGRQSMVVGKVKFSYTFWARQ